MAENVSSNESVLFRVTRPNTTVFHPDRSVSILPVQTGGEIELPKAVALYHVKNGVGVVVDRGAEAAAAKAVAEAAAAEAEEKAQLAAEAAAAAGETPKTEGPKTEEPRTEEPKVPVKRAPGRPAKTV
jgi:hypothetical protein